MPGTQGGHELLAFAAVYMLYDAGRWLSAGHFPTPLAHARRVIHLERSMHVAVEASVQRALDWDVAEWVLSNIYLTAQLAVLPASLIWPYRRSPRIYRQLRNTVVVAWLVAVPIFALFAVAAAPRRHRPHGHREPPAAVGLTGHSTIFYNPYAPVPSLHVGLALAVGTAVQATCRPAGPGCWR